MISYASYVICTSPRSGSTLLSNLLRATGVAGNPASYFHHPSISDWQKYFDQIPDASMSEQQILHAIFRAAITEGTLNTGMFGLRLQQHSFDYFKRKLGILYPELSSDTQRFTKAFGRTAFLYLSRRNKFEQAVSYVKAEQTGLWHIAPDGTEVERLSPPQTPTYNFERIKTSFEEVKTSDRHWENWFQTENIVPLRISYEELSVHPIRSLGKVLDHLGVTYETLSDIEPRVAKMADKINQNWVERFRFEYTDF